jgi:hypothetical protein
LNNGRSAIVLQKRRRLIRYVLGNFTLLLVLVWVSSSFFQLFGPRHPHLCDNVEFPLSGIQSVIVDRKNRVYVLSGFYARLQVYDGNGRFLRGFFTAISGPSRLGFDEHDRLCQAALRRDRIFVYTDDGQLLEDRPGGRFAYKQWKSGQPWTRDSAGREFQVRRPMWDPTIVTVAPDGTERVFHSHPFYLWPLVGAMPCWISLVLTAVVNRFVFGARIQPDEADGDQPSRSATVKN